MATVNATSIRFGSSLKRANRSGQVHGLSSLKLVPLGRMKISSFPSLRTSHFRICCVAKPETVNKVCEIVRKQLALPPESELTPESKFSALGADSLDTVEIVMGLEEEFGISVEEESSQNITTVQEAADLIEKLVQKKAEAA
ncbi:acyl carrier protein 1, chloroplastic [Cinnamomum micranthum f. kanehirae]|uniref:Acyl carrier protein n=1 Tax=Cinnamomum micranthum f. kanehirae TaxID=337451 RepID=A0A3S3MPI6_9MAGN|nr:acyl carrier protein 1, chloroplastic [Cinnamomum micranthum f. kanehirae]